MTELKYLNKRHEKILHEFQQQIDKILYFSTENDESHNSWDAFKDVEEEIIQYHNSFFDKIGDLSELNEWIYSYPNFMYFCMQGFLANSSKLINTRYEEELHKRASKTTQELSNMVSDCIKKAKKEENDNISAKRKGIRDSK
tara:strand:- start:1268 stop:1693 length:426 start_codon:yes stop_codon:yes gene_type:complete